MSYRDSLKTSLLEVKVSYQGKSLSICALNIDMKMVEKCAVDSVAKKFNFPNSSLKAYFKNNKIDEHLEEIIVISKETEPLFCPSCKELKEELVEVKIELNAIKADALMRQSAINLEMYIKTIALPFLKEEQKKTYIFKDHRKHIRIDEFALYNTALLKIVGSVEEEDKFTEFLSSLGLVSIEEFDKLHETLIIMKRPFTPTAHPTVSMTDPSSPFTLDEFASLLQTYDAMIENKDLVIRMAQQMDSARNETGESFLKSF